jgi:hypothetical protein
MILKHSSNAARPASGTESQAKHYTSKYLRLAHALLKAHFVIPITLVNTYN